MVILMYMHAEFGGAHARGLGDMGFQRKKSDFLAIFGQFFAILGHFLRGAVPSL